MSEREELDRVLVTCAAMAGTLRNWIDKQREQTNANLLTDLEAGLLAIALAQLESGAIALDTLVNMLKASRQDEADRLADMVVRHVAKGAELN